MKAINIIFAVIGILGACALLYNGTIGKKPDHPVEKILFKIFSWLEYSQPMDWLVAFLSKLTIKTVSATILIIVTLYIGSRFMSPNTIERLSIEGLLSPGNLAIVLILIVVALGICAKILTPLIIANKYKALLKIAGISLVQFAATGYAVIWHREKVLRFIQSSEVIAVLSTIYGFILWISIAALFLLLLFFSLTIIIRALSWLIPKLNKLAWLIVGKYAKICLWSCFIYAIITQSVKLFTEINK